MSKMPTKASVKSLFKKISEISSLIDEDDLDKLEKEDLDHIKAELELLGMGHDYKHVIGAILKIAEEVIF